MGVLAAPLPVYGRLLANPSSYDRQSGRALPPDPKRLAFQDIPLRHFIVEGWENGSCSYYLNIHLNRRLLGEVVRTGSQDPDQKNESEEEPHFVGATNGRHSNQTPLQIDIGVSQQYIGKAAELKLTVSSETANAAP
jgi:hypothetical protein